MSGHLSEVSPQHELSDAGHVLTASQDEVNQCAVRIVKRELGRSQGPSTGRLLTTLTYKHGYSLDAAKEALKYLQDHRKELGIPATYYTDKEAREAFSKFRADLRQKVGADMKPGFGQMPPFTAMVKASYRLQARADVVKAVRLMARSTPVTRVAVEGREQIRRALAALGYVAKTTTTRAFYDMKFTKAERVFHLVGWHGTGIYGPEKSVLEFIDEDVSKTRPVVTIGIINEENVVPSNQERVINDILEYINEYG